MASRPRAYGRIEMSIQEHLVRECESVCRVAVFTFNVQVINGQSN